MQEFWKIAPVKTRQIPENIHNNLWPIQKFDCRKNKRKEAGADKTEGDNRNME